MLSKQNIPVAWAGALEAELHPRIEQQLAGLAPFTEADLPDQLARQEVVFAEL